MLLSFRIFFVITVIAVLILAFLIQAELKAQEYNTSKYGGCQVPNLSGTGMTTPQHYFTNTYPESTQGRAPSLSVEGSASRPQYKILGAENVNGDVGLPYIPNLTVGQAAGRAVKSELKLLWSDTKNLYSWSNAGNYGVMLTVGGILANTSMDQNFTNWYQDNVRSDATNDVSSFFKGFGEGQYVIPILVGGSLVYRFMEQKMGVGTERTCYSGEFFSRSMRSTLIGVPALLIGQVLIGAGRPNDGDGSSKWRPFDKTNGISGHAFIGSIPFITAAQMTDNCLLKGLLYTGSTLPALSRVNDDAHYLSQVILGWYLGYLSVRATTKTEKKVLPHGMTIFPIVSGETNGLGINYSF